MGLLHRMVRWYKFNYGIGNAMRSAGAELLPCPHCDTETPIYRSTYDSTGDPISFSICLWCDGFIEYSDTIGRPHEPYASVQEIQLDGRRSKP